MLVSTRPIYDLGVPDATDESSTLTVYFKNLLTSKIFNKTHSYLCGSAVGLGTALQVGRSRVRFKMMSLDFFH